MPREYDECHANNTALIDKIAAWDAELWEVACRQMQVDLMNGQIEQARKTLDSYCRDRIPGFLHLDRYISEVLPNKWCEALWEAGFTTMRSLTKASDEELQSIDNIGEGTVRKIRAICKAIAEKQIPDVGLFDVVDIGRQQPLPSVGKQELERELEFIEWKAKLIKKRLEELSVGKKPKRPVRRKR